MKEKTKKHFMKSCPSCQREVPPLWDTCVFCGNVFHKSPRTKDAPSMLYWNKMNDLKHNTLYINQQTLRKSREIKERSDQMDDD